MKEEKKLDVIIVGGSYSGLAAAMALGRSLRQVLIIDKGEPCNRQTPYSHNFITQDGKPPGDIARIAKEQVLNYKTVKFLNDMAVNGARTENGFSIQTASGETFESKKLIFATGIKDQFYTIRGIAECWGISLLHCPYCHGYEVRGEPTGILGNDDFGFEFASLISNWTTDLTLFTSGPSTLTHEQTEKLKIHHISIIDKEIEKLDHHYGRLQRVFFKDGTVSFIKILYTRFPFKQHCIIPELLGCELTHEGYLKVDATQQTTVNGVYACGDNTSRIRTVANAVSMGTTAGMMANKEMILQEFP